MIPSQITNEAFIRFNLRPRSIRKQSEVSMFKKKRHCVYCQGNDSFLHINVFYFQLATRGVERAVYKKLIAPFKDDLPTGHSEGFRRVCADHNYAYIGIDILDTKFSRSLSCQLVPLPETSYREPWAFIISKNSPYKGLINWR